MAHEFEVVFKNEEVKEFIGELSGRLDNIKSGDAKYVGLLSAIVFGDVMSHFKDQEGSGGPWQKWSASYRKQMQERGRGGNNILQDTGKLRQNFKPTNYKSSSEGITWFNDAQTKGGFPYAFAHNEGGGILPKRDFMWLSEKAMTKIEDQTLQFMLDEGI